MRRHALITGGSRGIGAAVAEVFVQEGWAVTISARSLEDLEHRRQALLEVGKGPVYVIPSDMANGDDVYRLAQTQEAEFDRLDALVLNAGMGSIGLLAEYSLRRLDRMLAVNFRGPYALIQALLPMLRSTAQTSRYGAKVIAVSSMIGLTGEPLNSAYGSTKAALISLCETLNTEESAHGVMATAVCPGYVATDMTNGLAATVAAREDMLNPEDVALVVHGLTNLSARAVVPCVAITRPGSYLWRA